MRTATFLPVIAFVFATQALSAADFAGPNQFICGTNTVMEAVALGSGESGLWNVVSGSATFANVTSPFSAVSGLSFGENVMRWTVTSSAGPASDLVSIWCYNNAMPVANAGADQNVSDPPASVQLNGSAPIHPGTCFWTIVAGTGTISDANDPNATVSQLGTGTNVLQWNCDNGPCGSSSDIVEVVVAEAIGIDEVAMKELDMYFDTAGKRMVFGARSQQLSIVLVDTQGRAIRHVNTAAGVGTWDLSDLPAGAYLATAHTGRRAYAIRFVVSR